jgi:hypothetical protein
MDLRSLLNALIQKTETNVLSQIEPKGSGVSAQPTPTAPVLPGGPPSPPSTFAQPSGNPTPLAQPGPTAQAGPGIAAQQRIDPSLNPPPASDFADVYHGAEAPSSTSLLGQSGVGAYTQLLNVLATNELDQKSVAQLTNSLGNASFTLKSTYYEAVSRLPTQLQQKDWGFSVSDGRLVFTAGQDELSAQDLADLQKAFAGTNVESAARQVVAAITSIELMRQSGVDSGSLALGQLKVDEANFSDVVNLRAYITATTPGGKYVPNATDPTNPTGQPHTNAVNEPQIPIILGGMDLRHLITARPDFHKANGPAKTAEPHESEASAETQERSTLHGQCSCGEVCLIVEDAFDYAFYCHCSRCRLRTGSAFAAIAGIGIDKVQVTAGSDHLLIEGECSDGYGARCSRCYTFLFTVVRDRQYLHMSLGALVDAPGRAPDHHIYVGSKAPWFQITDSLPQYDELP